MTRFTPMSEKIKTSPTRSWACVTTFLGGGGV